MTVQPLRDHEWCIPHDHIEPDPDIWGPVAVDPIRPPETDLDRVEWLVDEPSGCPDCDEPMGDECPHRGWGAAPSKAFARWDGVQFAAYPVDPIRPPETDEEPWIVVAADALPALLPLPLVIALGVIVGILVAWAVR